MMRKTNILCVLMSIFAISAYGQQRQILTFEDALLKTNTQNDQIKALEHEESAVEKERKAACGLRLPNISAAGTYAYMSDDIGFDLNGLKQPVSNVVGGIAGGLPPELGWQIGGAVNQLLTKDWNLVLQEKSLAMAGVTMTMPLYMGGKINAANNAAKIRVEEAIETGNQTKNALVSELAQRYFGLSLALQVVEVRKQVLDGMEKHLADAKALETNGMIARGERLYAEMHVAEAKKEYSKAIRDAETINSALCNTLNEEGVYAPVTTMFIINNLESVSYFKNLAIEKNPLLKQVSLKSDLAKEGVRAERSEFFPKVALMGGYSFYNYQVTSLVPTWVVGAGIKINIFDGLSREYKYSAAKSKVRQVDALSQKAGSDVTTLVEKVYNEMITSADQITSNDVALEFATEYLRIKEQAFLEGSASSSDVVDARLNLAKLKTERLSSAYSYDLLLARLLEVCGESNFYNSYITTKDITPIHNR